MFSVSQKVCTDITLGDCVPVQHSDIMPIINVCMYAGCAVGASAIAQPQWDDPISVPGWDTAPPNVLTTTR